ncbi:MAG: rod shape-determining protein MreC [Oscillospiraceae bacterium]|nr:rod shape-determining protein MreC [Oscillospiraceae bacterium]
MKHYFTKKVKIILVVAAVLAALLAVLSNLTGLGLPEMFVQGVLTPIRVGASALTDQAEQMYSYMFHYESLQAENESLKDRLAELEEDARQAAALARENDRLRALLELKANRKDFQTVDAYVITRSSVDWTNTITIDRGTNAGIQVGMCAITAQGEVIGLVTEAGHNYAVVKTVLDSSLEISATIATSGYTGMVSGSYTTGREDLLRMDYLASSAIIRNNDQVVTAGSTVYPRDLILGYVIDAGFDSTGVAKFALLRPAADFSTLEQVFIITAYEVG